MKKIIALIFIATIFASCHSNTCNLEQNSSLNESENNENIYIEEDDNSILPSDEYSSSKQIPVLTTETLDLSDDLLSMEIYSIKYGESFYDPSNYLNKKTKITFSVFEEYIYKASYYNGNLFRIEWFSKELYPIGSISIYSNDAEAYNDLYKNHFCLVFDEDIVSVENGNYIIGSYYNSFAIKPENENSDCSYINRHYLLMFDEFIVSTTFSLRNDEDSVNIEEIYKCDKYIESIVLST